MTEKLEYIQKLIDQYNKEQINMVNIFINKSNIALNSAVKKIEQENEDNLSDVETLTEEEVSTEEIENSDDEDFIDDNIIKEEKKDNYQSFYIN